MKPEEKNPGEAVVMTRADVEALGGEIALSSDGSLAALSAEVGDALAAPEETITLRSRDGRYYRMTNVASDDRVVRDKAVAIMRQYGISADYFDVSR